MSRSGAECAPNDSHCFAIGRPPVHNEFHEAGKTLIEVFDADSAASLEPCCRCRMTPASLSALK